MTADPAVGTMGYANGGQMTSVVKAGTTYAYSYASDTQDKLLSEATPQGSYGLSYGRPDATGRPVIEALTWSGAPGASAHLANDDTGTPVGLTTTAGGQGMYVYDAQGSPIALITSGANTSFTYSFDPYGVATQTTTTGDLSAQETPFLYTGGVNDRTTGWTKDGNRYYSSTVGRWTQRDTLDAPLDPADANRYAYAGDNPVNDSDPLGAFSISFTVCDEVCLVFGSASSDGRHSTSIGVGLGEGASISVNPKGEAASTGGTTDISCGIGSAAAGYSTSEGVYESLNHDEGDGEESARADREATTVANIG